jgi:2-amino-1-hydroxyethylphosphonate dioxygenase (glycine-forming)
MQNQAEKIAQSIIDLYLQHGDANYIGESISQAQHAVQAGIAAIEADESNDMIVASFLHDIGHLLEHIGDPTVAMGEFGTRDHESLGAEYLRLRGFSARVVSLISSHVPAKRYLVSTSPAYFNTLSEASKATFVLQGGLMSPDEITGFEHHPDFNARIQLRQYDDAAKRIDITPQSPAVFYPYLLHHLIQNQVDETI